MTLHLACLLGRPVEDIYLGQVSVLRQAGTGPVWEEHHHIGLGVVGLQADAVEERGGQVEGGLQKGGVSGSNDTVIRIEDGGDDTDVSGVKARLLHLEDPHSLTMAFTIRLKMVGKRGPPWVTPRSDLNTRPWQPVRYPAY